MSSHKHLFAVDAECDCGISISGLVKSQRAEIARLRGMIGYASHAPTLGSAITILNDALNGVTGADNVHEVRSEITRLRGALKKIRDNPEFETEVGIEDIARAALEGREE